MPRFIGERDFKSFIAGDILLTPQPQLAEQASAISLESGTQSQAFDE
jgi:hypothetical protein